MLVVLKLKSENYILSRDMTNILAFSFKMVPLCGFNNANAVSIKHRYICDADSSLVLLGLNFESNTTSCSSDFKNKNF
jgi:hypothetical protein